jgi:hypothetical protein
MDQEAMRSIHPVIADCQLPISDFVSPRISVSLDDIEEIRVKQKRLSIANRKLAIGNDPVVLTS